MKCFTEFLLQLKSVRGRVVADDRLSSFLFMPNSLITGITGQDGAYLARFLLKQQHTITGTVRSGASTRGADYATLRALKLANEVRLIEADFEDAHSLRCAIESSEPDEIYNLAAQSSVARSFQEPTATGEVTGLGVARLLDAMRATCPQARFYQASSSEMYGKATEVPQRETTPFYPRSPYGAAKVYAHWMTINYREAYGCHASCGILFNHESPLRPAQFVTRKITQAVARIKHGLKSSLSLGNLDIARDWGFAGDYVRAMSLMLQQEAADDYIIATGHTHSLRDFVQRAFACVDLDYEAYVRIDPAFFRPAEINAVVGDPAKAREKLGWEPSMNFDQLVEFLVEAELRRVAGEDDKVNYFMEPK